MAQNQNSGEDNTGFFDEEGKKAEESEKREKIQDKKTEATKTKPESEENNQELDPYSEIDNASEDFITALEEELKKEESE